MNKPDTINIKYPLDDKNKEVNGNIYHEKHNYGISALYGRSQKNVTFHQRGAYDETKFDNAFPSAYFKILKSAFQMALMFFKSK